MTPALIPVYLLRHLFVTEERNPPSIDNKFLINLTENPYSEETSDMPPKRKNMCRKGYTGLER